ncbi:MAG: TatD family hydrolase [Pseudomonadota bacterium]
MFDTHVNLHADAFDDDLPAVLDRARAAGVTRFLAICDRFDNFPTVREIAETHADIWCSAGVHPHHAKDFAALTADVLVNAARHSKVVAIGETGLDFHYGYSPEADQVASLRRHIEAARETGLPLILHTREADRQVIEILEEEHAKGPFLPLLHCYTGGIDLARCGLALGGYVSVSGILSFKNAHDVRAVIAEVPMDRLILETDCPYLAPMPLRGRRNEPAYLPHVGAALAKVKALPEDAVLRVTDANARRLFWKTAP